MLNNFIFNLFLHSGFLVNFTHIDSIIELEFKSRLFQVIYSSLFALLRARLRLRPSRPGREIAVEKISSYLLIYLIDLYTTQEMNHHVSDTSKYQGRNILKKRTNEHQAFRQ